MRLKLINCNLEILQAVLAGDEALAQTLQAKVPANWSEFGAPAFQYALEQVQPHPETAGWWTYLPVLESENTVVGSGGYKGPPDTNGWVEIGYEISQPFRGRGLATEMSQQLVEQAFRDPGVKGVCAHTLAEMNASCRVLEKSGFKMVNEIEDEEEGKIWRWECPRQN